MGVGCVPVCLRIGIFLFSEWLRFSSGSRGRFEAACGANKHGKRCRISGTSKPPKGGLHPVQWQGRPLSLLRAWLTGCNRSYCKDLWQHVLFMSDPAFRKKCRDRLLQSENPVMLTLLRAEIDSFAWEKLDLALSD